MKRKYSAFTLEEAMQLVPADNFVPWELSAPPRAASDRLLDILRRRESFDIQTSEVAKALIIDDMLTEIVPNHPTLKVWKGAPLVTDRFTGVVDYLFTPQMAFVSTPLLCIVEAKRDDFVRGRAQCVAEMVACVWKNEQEGHVSDVFGIVSNGRNWQFYKLTTTGDLHESTLYSRNSLDGLLGALDYVCGECAKLTPPPSHRAGCISVVD